jgi:hypothetical protein
MVKKGEKSVSDNQFFKSSINWSFNLNLIENFEHFYLHKSEKKMTKRISEDKVFDS